MWTATRLRDLYRDMVVVRRIDAEAMALQRQGELALWAPLLGQEAAQVGSARALRPDDFVFPSYREHGVAYCLGVDPVQMLRLWRGAGLSGWDPAAARHRHSRHRRRLPAAARHRLRARDHARRGQLRGPDVLRRRGHQRRRRGGGLRLRRQLRRAGRLLLPEQPVGHLRAGPPAVPRLHRPARPGLRHPRHAGRRQRCAGCPRRHAARAGPRLGRRGSDPH